MHITGNACQNFYTHMQIPLSTAYASKAQGYHPPDRKYPQCHMVAGGFNPPRGWNLRGGLGWNHPICRDGTPAVTCLNHHNKIAVFMPPCCCGPKEWKKGYLFLFRQNLKIMSRNPLRKSLNLGWAHLNDPAAQRLSALQRWMLNLKRSKGHMVAAIWLASSQGMILAKDTPRHFKLSVFFRQPLLKVIWKRKRSHGWTSSGPGDKTGRTQERPWRDTEKTVAHLPFWPHPRICRPVQVNTTLTH